MATYPPLRLTEASKITGINRGTLSKIANEKGYSTVTSNIDALCEFFGCEVGELMVYLPSEEKD